MAKAFKDFNKETKDLIGKNFPAAGSYKVEVKDKAADRTVAIAPTAEFAGEKKSLNIDVEYNMKEYALKTKTAVSASGDVKPKVTYEPAKGHKIETTLMSLSADSDFEVSYEGNVAGFNVTDKVTKKGGDASASYQVVPALTVGASVLFAFKGGFNVTSHSVGARFVQSGVTFNVVATDMKKYVTGVYYPLKLSCCTVKTAVQFTCAKGKFAAAAAVEAPYKIKPCDCEVTLKAKVTNDLAFGFAVIKKLANNWTAVVAMESKECCKFGVQLTRE